MLASATWSTAQTAGELQWKVHVHLKNVEYDGKVTFFPIIQFKKTEAFIFSRFITHKVKYYKPLLLELMTIQKTLSQIIRILHETNFYEKKGLEQRNFNIREIQFMRSVVVRGSFCTNDWIRLAVTTIFSTQQEKRPRLHSTTASTTARKKQKTKPNESLERDLKKISLKY